MNLSCMKTVAVVGLGYVGLPLAELCAEKGYKTFGIEIDAKRIEAVNSGKNPISGEKLRAKVGATSDFAVLKECDVAVICVDRDLIGLGSGLCATWSPVPF